MLTINLGHGYFIEEDPQYIDLLNESDKYVFICIYRKNHGAEKYDKFDNWEGWENTPKGIKIAFQMYCLRNRIKL